MPEPTERSAALEPARAHRALPWFLPPLGFVLGGCDRLAAGLVAQVIDLLMILVAGCGIWGLALLVTLGMTVAAHRRQGRGLPVAAALLGGLATATHGAAAVALGHRHGLDLVYLVLTPGFPFACATALALGLLTARTWPDRERAAMVVVIALPAGWVLSIGIALLLPGID